MSVDHDARVVAVWLAAPGVRVGCVFFPPCRGRAWPQAAVWQALDREYARLAAAYYRTYGECCWGVEYDVGPVEFAVTSDAIGRGNAIDLSDDGRRRNGD